jgi:hypothetical protein
LTGSNVDNPAIAVSKIAIAVTDHNRPEGDLGECQLSGKQFNWAAFHLPKTSSGMGSELH